MFLALKDLNGQNHSSSGPYRPVPVKKFPSDLLPLFGEPCLPNVITYQT